MSEEILINISPMETRVGVLENGMLQEVYIERSSKRGLVGNIYKGKVLRVLPGMQAAFVDVGLERSAFIHTADIVTLNDEGIEEREKNTADICEALKEGESIIVQVTKDPIGTKGARLTTHLSLPSRYLVYMPRTQHIGISQRIEDDQERQRLTTLVKECIAAEGLEGNAGFIIRTVAEGVGKEEIAADIRFLKRLWVSVQAAIKNAKAPCNIYEELPLFLRSMRDFIRPGLEKVRVDSQESFLKIQSFVDSYVPELDGRVELYQGERPIFDLYNVEDEVQKALGRKVSLKSGGYLIFDQTEAMTTIDINTGAFVGHRNLEETIFKTNLEAATAIGRQLRLRNIGGIIIIDFIDMLDVEHQRQVMRMLEKVLERDHAKTNIIGMSDLGLVEMTRKRTRESLQQVVCEPCPECDGRGSVKTAETVCYEVLREILRQARAYSSSSQSFLVLASQAVAERLLDEDSSSLADLESFINRSVTIQMEPMYAQEEFDVVFR
ncbi:MAG: ribonuclease G [Pseudomonadales bacterium]|nr:ribonuclease G [Pseudomonadales bacterium]